MCKYARTFRSHLKKKAKLINNFKLSSFEFCQGTFHIIIYSADDMDSFLVFVQIVVENKSQRTKIALILRFFIWMEFFHVAFEAFHMVEHFPAIKKITIKPFLWRKLVNACNMLAICTKMAKRFFTSWTCYRFWLVLVDKLVHAKAVAKLRFSE